MKEKILLFLIISFCATAIFAQDDVEQNLAFQYYHNGEYDKAAQLFGKLYSKNRTESYYRYLFNSLIYLKEYEQLQKIVEKNIKKFESSPIYPVDLGYLFIQQGNVSKGKNQYNDVIKLIKADDGYIIQLANSFINYEELALAANTFEKGRQVIGTNNIFSLELAELYVKLSNPKNSIANYLTYLDYHPRNSQLIKNELQSIVRKEDFATELRTQLLVRIQRSPQDKTYSELLIWHYLQNKNFKAASIQSKALDKRFKENGYRLMNVARAALKEQDYNQAIESYNYIVNKGKASPFYLQAKKEILKAYKEKVTNSLTYTQEDLAILKNKFDEFIEEFGVNEKTASTIRDKAQLLAFYLNNYDEAISLLEGLLDYPQIDRKLKGEFKLELGDFYVMKQEVWESALLYGQVDKAFKDEPLGELARFKRAKLSYYQGEFEWAQAQLNILKASTSELMANDALQLSVFIMDNMGLDTTLYPMEKFARADLLYYQNQLDEALTTLDSITQIFPDHALKDDIYFLKANIYSKKQNFTEVAVYLQKIIDEFPEEILGDDATFKLAKLYEQQLDDKAKAQQLYQDLVFNYKDSIYLIEARKRFRALRGDQL